MSTWASTQIADSRLSNEVGGNVYCRQSDGRVGRRFRRIAKRHVGQRQQEAAMCGAPGIPVLFVNPEPDDEAPFGRPVEEWAKQIEEGTRAKKRRKSFRDFGVGRSGRHRAPTAPARS
jgi:hypothetical protein